MGAWCDGARQSTGGLSVMGCLGCLRVWWVVGGDAELVQLVGPHTLTRGDGRRERARIEIEGRAHLGHLTELYIGRAFVCMGRVRVSGERAHRAGGLSVIGRLRLCVWWAVALSSCSSWVLLHSPVGMSDESEFESRSKAELIMVI